MLGGHMPNKQGDEHEHKAQNTEHKKQHLILSQEGERPVCVCAAELDGEVGDVPSHWCHPSAQDVLDSSVVVIVCLHGAHHTPHTGRLETSIRFEFHT